jgi:hypothetical protein
MCVAEPTLREQRVWPSVGSASVAIEIETCQRCGGLRAQPRRRLSATAPSPTEYIVRCQWDDEAGVWYVDDTDVPGLSTEAETFELLEH